MNLASLLSDPPFLEWWEVPLMVLAWLLGLWIMGRALDEWWRDGLEFCLVVLYICDREIHCGEYPTR